MPTIAGVDGCPAGWIALVENTTTRSITAFVFENFAGLVEALDAVVIAIDIPIGLTERGARQCDVDARQRLGAKRGTSVFPAPIRPALGASSYEQAKHRSMAVQKKAISQQAWAIYPKIREVDEALRSSANLRGRVIEVHPEVTFSAWNGAPILAPKRKPEGRAIRRKMIDEHFGPLAFSSARATIEKSQAADDDIADAFAGLWTAQRFLNDRAQTLPPSPPFDIHELPMRMVY